MFMQKEKQMNEVAKYSNELNKLPLRGMNLNQKKVFATFLWMIKETSGEVIEMDYDKFMELTQTKPRSLSAGREIVKNTIKKVMSLSIAEISTDKSDVFFPFFVDAEISKESGDIRVAINPRYAHYIKDFATAFTTLPLEIHNSFRGEYTGDIYKFFRQYSDTGFWAVTVEDFRKYLAIPSSYNLGMIAKQIIDPAIEELKGHYPELRYDKIYEKKKRGQRGRPKVSSLRFYFTKEGRENWIEGKYEDLGETEKQTNVPEWSNEDYKNETSPEKQKELAQMKSEMLSRLNDSEKK